MLKIAIFKVTSALKKTLHGEFLFSSNEVYFSVFES